MWNREASLINEKAAPPSAAPGFSSGPAEERRVVAWVGKSVVFKGELVSSEDMTIDGRVEGTIELRNHTLTIGPDAHILADIVAKMVTVLGTVIGTITADDKIFIRETGSVQGDVLSPRLAMADGAVLRGRVDTGTRRVTPHGAAVGATASVAV
jgi:cytoskeletal protein CcmA (bactofilin family)